MIKEIKKTNNNRMTANSKRIKENEHHSNDGQW